MYIANTSLEEAVLRTNVTEHKHGRCCQRPQWHNDRNSLTKAQAQSGHHGQNHVLCNWSEEAIVQQGLNPPKALEDVNSGQIILVSFSIIVFYRLLEDKYICRSSRSATASS